MGTFPQKLGKKGSLKWIQILVNQHQYLLNSLIQSSKLEIGNIEWVSPLAKDKYAEYRDKTFLKQLGLVDYTSDLKDFWPNHGPQWDALAKTTDKRQYLLVEAKANIPEFVSPPTSAKAVNSIEKINMALCRTKNFIASKSKSDWSQYFYQYCNRLAHLFFMRKVLKKDAYLIFIYFVGDHTVKGPMTQGEWESAIKVMKQYLGIDKKHKLSKFILNVFIDVKSLN
ncbi:MAG: hypothetical protein P9L97_06315 [Candidatus Tenebribacter davisii]|nr:hypothetical protein [Candidatus Tenebribacter davisii]